MVLCIYRTMVWLLHILHIFSAHILLYIFLLEPGRVFPFPDAVVCSSSGTVQAHRLRESNIGVLASAEGDTSQPSPQEKT